MFDFGASDVDKDRLRKFLESAASTATLMGAIRWTVYPGWAGQGVSGFPIANFSWGNLAIIDGHVIPAAPVDVLSSGMAPAMVPLIIASTAQETDLFPLTDVRNLSWAQYDDLAREKMKPFGQGVVDATLSLYPHVGDPELQYSSLSSDIGVNCPQNTIAAQIARGWKTRLYRYVLTASPSHPMFMLGSGFPGRYAFHTLDSVYLFNTTVGAMGGGVEPTGADESLTRRLRADISSFVRTGAIKSWAAYPATVLLGDGGAVTNISVAYHAKACGFWESHGFWKYSWAGN